MYQKEEKDKTEKTFKKPMNVIFNSPFKESQLLRPLLFSFAYVLGFVNHDNCHQGSLL